MDCADIEVYAIGAGTWCRQERNTGKYCKRGEDRPAGLGAMDEDHWAEIEHADRSVETGTCGGVMADVAVLRERRDPTSCVRAASARRARRTAHPVGPEIYGVRTTERQVDLVESGDAARVGRHLRELMCWNIQLFDLEAVSFGLVWIFLMGLLVFSTGAAAEQTLKYGTVFAVVMYVFQFTGSVIVLPLYYQRWLRLREVSGRLGAISVVA